MIPLSMKAEELLNACRTEYRFAVKENHGRYTVTQTVTYSDASGNTIGTPQTLTIFDSVLTGADLRKSLCGAIFRHFEQPVICTERRRRW